MSSLLRLENISVQFGGLHALSNIHMQVPSGQIVALIGPNGAGKTTLFNLLTGIYKPTAGDIYFKERNISKLEPYERARIGIARTFQNTRLIKGMTVLENVLIAHPECNSESLWRSLFLTNKARSKRREITEQCIDRLKIVGLHHKLTEMAGALPYGEQRLLEIARALVTGCEVLLLDEPAAGMNRSEKLQLTERIRFLSKEHHINMILIEHDIRLIMDISDKIFVLDHGELIAEGAPEEIRNDPKVINAYLGGGDDLYD